MESLEILREALDRWRYFAYYLQLDNLKSRTTTLSQSYMETFALGCIQMERWLKDSLWELDPPPLNGAKQYSLDDLKEMTDNFSSKYLIKKTMHGRLFRGFSDNREVTIKTWDFFCPDKRVYEDHPMRFCNELDILIDENPHPTLMKLKGFCFKHILAVVYDEKPTNFLSEELYAGKNFGLDARMEVATQLASLFIWLHDKGMTFGDVDTSTIIIDNVSSFIFMLRGKSISMFPNLQKSCLKANLQSSPWHPPGKYEKKV
ncbi:unnamed protein product [Cuscuta campestris]|uniref:Protein kinase domain-containing protein n=1 Tax=Cuscuta campestris TaxID=132261 RepID=A0A484LKV0_9ASTE|nr:unnamed protein product [Cuscuta campestris]